MTDLRKATTVLRKEKAHPKTQKSLSVKSSSKKLKSTSTILFGKLRGDLCSLYLIRQIRAYAEIKS